MPSETRLMASKPWAAELLDLVVSGGRNSCFCKRASLGVLVTR